jgi:hypothetical protein
MIKKLALLLMAVWVLATPLVASAATPTPSPAAAATKTVCKSKWNLFGINPWYACLESDGRGGVKFTKLNDIYLIILPAIDSLIKVAALISIGMIFYMFIRMMYARGDAGKIATATSGIRDAVVGFVVCMISVAIVNFVVGSFQ